MEKITHHQHTETLMKNFLIVGKTIVIYWWKSMLTDQDSLNLQNINFYINKGKKKLVHDCSQYLIH